MIRIIDEKDSGKTRKLLEECSKNRGLFVCAHPERIQEKCIAYNIPLNFYFCSYDLFEYAEKDQPIYIDELETFVSRIVPNLAGYCLSKED